MKISSVEAGFLLCIISVYTSLLEDNNNMFVLNCLAISAFRKHQGGRDHLVVVFGGGCGLRKKDMSLSMLNLSCILRLGIVKMGN